MNPSSLDPLNGLNTNGSSSRISGNRTEGLKKGDSTDKTSGQSKSQELARIKEQVANGSYTVDLQSLAKKMITGGYLNA